MADDNGLSATLSGFRKRKVSCSIMRDAVRNFRYLIVPIAAVGLLTSIEWWISETPESTVSAADWQGAGFGPSSFSAAIARSNSDIALGRERVKNGPDHWLRHESLARSYLRRSQLSYSYDELASAGETLAKSKRLAPSGSGPFLTDASFARMSHRFGRAKASLTALDLAAVKGDPEILAESESLKGDLAFYRGDMDRARRHYENAGKFGPNAGLSFRRAILAKSRGKFEEAIRHFADANPDPAQSTPFANASVAFQIGGVELARGEYRTAREWFEAANELFSGFWLFEAHLAQARALEGDLAGAIAEMELIANRAPSGEVLDALAMLLRAEGRARESRQWADRAEAIWQKRLTQLPEAAYGHAVDHELVFGSPASALDLAKRNFAARPYGGSRILLASALLANRSVDEAIEQLSLAEGSGWRSAPLYALLAQANDLAGNLEEAADARRRAKSLNPRIFDSETPLVWLSHG